MNSLRFRMLFMLLPPLSFCFVIISLFFFFLLKYEIQKRFDQHLLSSVIAAANSLDETEIEQLKQGVERSEPLLQKPFFKSIYNSLWKTKQNLNLDALFIVTIEEEKSKQESGLAVVHRQRYLIDVTVEWNQFIKGSKQGEEGFLPGSTDFSESQEVRLYTDKKAMVTTPYIEKSSSKWLITAYAPILTADGQVIALLGADISYASLKRQWLIAGWIIALTAVVVLALVCACLLIVTKQIASPVRRLNEAAIEIAAGHYGATVDIKGPQELYELANTLNTLSECLQEKEERHSYALTMKEQLFGEIECTQLLQNKLFDEPLSCFSSNSWSVVGVRTKEALTPGSCRLRLKEEAGLLECKLTESGACGLDAFLKLLEGQKEEEQIVEGQREERQREEREEISRLEVYSEKRQCWCLVKGRTTPLLWSAAKQHCLQLKPQTRYDLASDDKLFIASTSLVELMGEEKKLKEWVERLLRHFATTDEELLLTKLQQQLFSYCDHARFKQDLFVLLLTLH